MFTAKKTTKNHKEACLSNLDCLFCGKKIPIYRLNGYVEKRAWFCSTLCSKKISYKITYQKLTLLKNKFLKDNISLSFYDWKEFLEGIEKNK